jgi:hypothetical protein
LQVLQDRDIRGRMLACDGQALVDVRVVAVGVGVGEFKTEAANDHALVSLPRQTQDDGSDTS